LVTVEHREGQILHMRWIVARAASMAALASTTWDFAAPIAASVAATCAAQR